MEIIKKLEEIITKGTKTYTQIGKNDSAYLYEITDSETDHVYYEVFERKEVKGRILPSGTLMSDRVAYPSNSDFGKWAFCISRGTDHKTALKCALFRFHSLCELKEVA